MYWQNQLDKALLQLVSEGKAPRIAVLGIGSELHSADAAGVIIVRVLIQNNIYGEHLLVINAGIAPENKLGELRHFSPDLVLIIDAAQMGLKPGSVRCIDPRTIGGFSFSTHTLPLQLLCRYISHETGSQVIILGIQPDDVAFKSALSPLMKESLRAVLHVLAKLLQPSLQPTSDCSSQVDLFIQGNFPGCRYDLLSTR